MNRLDIREKAEYIRKILTEEPRVYLGANGTSYEQLVEDLQKRNDALFCILDYVESEPEYVKDGMMQWISAADNLPEECEHVLVSIINDYGFRLLPCFMEYMYDKNAWYSKDMGYISIEKGTHWQPIPEPPV